MKPAQRCPSSTLQLARQHPSGSPHLPGSGQSASGEPAKEAWGSPWREGPLHWVAGSLQLRVRLGEILRDAGPKRRRVSLCICQRAGPSLSPCSGRPLLARPGWWTHVDLWTSRRKPRGKLWFFFFFFWFPLLIISLRKSGFSSSSDCHLKDSSLTQSLCWWSSPYIIQLVRFNTDNQFANWLLRPIVIRLAN